MSEQDIPTRVETSDIATNLHTTILLAVIMGMYTVVYLGTIYIYIVKKRSRRHLVPAIVTMLYLSNVAEFGIEWYSAKFSYINSGSTRESVFLSLFNYPVWVSITLEIPQYIAFVLSDILLIWRCFFVWDGSLRVILMPMCLLIIEIGLLLAQIVLHTKYGSTTVSFALAALFNRLLAAAYFITASTTIVTTILIAYRIYSVTKQEGISAGRFKRVTDIVIQSGAVNSLALLTLAITVIIDDGFHSITDTRSFAAFNYMWSILSILGISTTVLVARVALLTDDTTLPSSSIHLSGLQFYMCSTHCTATQDVDIIGAGQPSRSGVISEGEKAEQKRGSSV